MLYLLLRHLHARCLTCTMSYSKITNKFTFTAGSGVTIVLNSNSFLNQFGFTVAQHTETTTLTSNKVVDLMTIKNIYIKLNNLSNQRRLLLKFQLQKVVAV